MLSYCEICQTRFEREFRKDMDKYIVPVCSASCFKAWLAKHAQVLTNLHDHAQTFTRREQHMRSEWEREFAAILKTLNINFQYEPFVFKVGPRLAYAPDFFLLSGFFAEVKGRWQPNDKRKVHGLAETFPVIVIDGDFLGLLRRSVKASAKGA